VTSSTATAATTLTERSEELQVTQEELLAATKKMASRTRHRVRAEFRAESGRRRWRWWPLACGICLPEA
jgi:hypothetical protein